MAAGVPGAASAVARRRSIVASMAYGVIELEPDQFLLALTLESEPLGGTKFGDFILQKPASALSRRSCSHMASVKGAETFCESVDELALHDGSIMVEAKPIKVPSDI